MVHTPMIYVIPLGQFRDVKDGHIDAGSQKTDDRSPSITECEASLS